MGERVRVVYLKFRLAEGPRAAFHQRRDHGRAIFSGRLAAQHTPRERRSEDPFVRERLVLRHEPHRVQNGHQRACPGHAW